MVTLGVPGGKKPTGRSGGEPGSGPIDDKRAKNSTLEEGVDRRQFLRTAGTTGVALGVAAWATPLVQTTVPAWAATGSGGPGDGSPESGRPGNQGSARGDGGGGEPSGDDGGTGDGGGAGNSHRTGNGHGAAGGGASNAPTPANPSAAAAEADGTVGAGAHGQDQAPVGAASTHAAVDPRRLVAFGGGAIAVGSAAVGASNRIVKPHHSTPDPPAEDLPDTTRGPA